MESSFPAHLMTFDMLGGGEGRVGEGNVRCIDCAPASTQQSVCIAKRWWPHVESLMPRVMFLSQRNGSNPSELSTMATSATWLLSMAWHDIPAHTHFNSKLSEVIHTQTAQQDLNQRPVVC